MNALRTFTLLLTLLILQGCKNSLLIERSETLLLNKNGNAKVICIDPRFYFEEDAKNYQLKKSKKITESLKKDIVKFSKKNGIELELYVLNDKATPAYYDDLLSLKRNMLAVNFNQRTPLNFNYQMEENMIQKKIFVYPPKISPDFNSLSKTYGTPYFSYIGIYQVKDEMVLYHIVVDTDQAETIYREYKTVKKELNNGVIAQMIYDSYAMLEKELTRK